MLTTGIFQTTVRRVSVKSVDQPIRLIPFGDVHWGAPGFSERHWREFIASAKKAKNAYFLGLGDYCDFASTSERGALRKIDLHDATRDLLETVASKQLTEFRRSIEFMRGNLLGVIGGNHTFEFADGQTADEKLANLLDAPFLGVCGLIRLQIECHGKRCSVDIFAHHGRGGGGYTEGNSINQVAKIRQWMQADIYIEGHDHDRWTKPGKPYLVPFLDNKTNTLHVRERPTLLARSGSFLKAYEPGARSYIVDKALGPCQLGAIEIQIHLKRDKERGFTFDLKGVA